MKFYIETFGCKVNSYESNYVKQSLIKSGFLFTEDLARANIVIINTCTVTNTADAKCRKFVRKVKRENKDIILVVMGCSVQNNYDEYRKMDIDILIGNKNKSEIANLIKQYLQDHQKYTFIEKNRDLSFEEMTITDFDHTRAFIKIQDGCDNFCSYCIIPYVRGKCRSKNFEEIIEEAKLLVKNNHHEIVLTGIHTGSYKDREYDLVDVINELSKIDGLERIRLSSVEVTELNDKFLKMLKENSKFCNHLHIPLQAGSDEILKKMNRKYDLNYYFQKIHQIRQIRPDISITTDIIVGFPGETNEMFEKTYENALKLKFSKIHVFPYSKRNGTVASKMSEVTSHEKTNRVHKLLNLSQILEKEYENQFLGKNLDVLIEEVKDNVSIGHSSNYILVKINKKLEKGNIYSIKYQMDNNEEKVAQ